MSKNFTKSIGNTLFNLMDIFYGPKVNLSKQGIMNLVISLGISKYLSWNSYDTKTEIKTNILKNLDIMRKELKSKIKTSIEQKLTKIRQTLKENLQNCILYQE